MRVTVDILSWGQSVEDTIPIHILQADNGQIALEIDGRQLYLDSSEARAIASALEVFAQDAERVEDNHRIESYTASLLENEKQRVGVYKPGPLAESMLNAFSLCLCNHRHSLHRIDINGGVGCTACECENFELFTGEGRLRSKEILEE